MTGGPFDRKHRPPPRAPPPRSVPGKPGSTERDINGMLLVAEQYAAPYDLLAEALGVPPARVRAITARWRTAGYAVTGVLGPGPAWCWLTPGRDGRDRPRVARAPAVAVAPGAHPGGPRRPAVAPERSPPIRHGRGVVEVRTGRTRAALPPPRVGTPHIADAEVHWPSTGRGGPTPARSGRSRWNSRPSPPRAPRGSWPGCSPGPATRRSSTCARQRPGPS